MPKKVQAPTLRFRITYGNGGPRLFLWNYPNLRGGGGARKVLLPAQPLCTPEN